MRHYILLVTVLSVLSVQSQTTNTDAATLLTSKGRWYTGLSTSGVGYAGRERRLVTNNFFSPKIGYFFADRFSADISLRGFGIGSSPGMRKNILLNIEPGINYTVYRKNNFMTNLSAGVSFGNLQPGFRTTASFNTLLKAGAGFSWRFAKNPNFGLTLDAAYYLNPQTLRPISFMPSLSVGINFFFGKRKAKQPGPIE